MNNKNIFGRFYPNNISYLGKSLSKQGTIVFFRTKLLYPKDNLNCDKNNKIQLLHIVLWSRIIIAHHLAPPLTCVCWLCIPVKNSSYASLQTSHHLRHSPPRWVNLSLFSSALKFSGLFHTAHLVKLYPRIPRPTPSCCNSPPHVSILVWSRSAIITAGPDSADPRLGEAEMNKSARSGEIWPGSGQWGAGGCQYPDRIRLCI